MTKVQDTIHFRVKSDLDSSQVMEKKMRCLFGNKAKKFEEVRERLLWSLKTIHVFLMLILHNCKDTVEK
jgi:hypothetical protein